MRELMLAASPSDVIATRPPDAGQRGDRSFHILRILVIRRAVTTTESTKMQERARTRTFKKLTVTNGLRN